MPGRFEDVRAAGGRNLTTTVTSSDAAEDAERIGEEFRDVEVIGPLKHKGGHVGRLDPIDLVAADLFVARRRTRRDKASLCGALGRRDRRLAWRARLRVATDRLRGPLCDPQRRSSGCR